MGSERDFLDQTPQTRIFARPQWRRARVRHLSTSGRPAAAAAAVAGAQLLSSSNDKSWTLFSGIAMPSHSFTHTHTYTQVAKSSSLEGKPCNVVRTSYYVLPERRKMT